MPDATAMLTSSWHKLVIPRLVLVETRPRNCPAKLCHPPCLTTSAITSLLALPAVMCSGAHCQRDPDISSGTSEKDVEGWLESYERASTYNGWHDTLKLNNAIFYLAAIAILWFKNHESNLLMWAGFKTSTKEISGHPCACERCGDDTYGACHSKLGKCPPAT